MFILFVIYQEITKNDAAYEKRKEKRSASLITKKKHTLDINNIMMLMVIWKVRIRDAPCLNQTEQSFPLLSFPACKQNKRKRLIVKLCRNN